MSAEPQPAAPDGQSAADRSARKDAERLARRSERQVSSSPRLRVKSLKREAQSEEQSQAAGEESTGQGGAKIVMPELDERYPYATYRSAPPGEEAEMEELAAIAGVKRGREVSAGFLLGVALIIVALVGGLWMGRLQKKITSLENRLSQLEEPGPAGQ
ncbi:MAG: LapA family protein [Planctomycetes bacterium]|nr:LapA family protein [Planctomycetota bacterium]